MGKWSNPLGTVVVIVCLGMLAFAYLVLLPLLWSLGHYENIPLIMVAITWGVVSGYLSSRYSMAEVWESSRKRFDGPIHRTIPRIEEALAARGVRSTRRDRAKGSFLRAPFDEFLDLGGGAASIAIQARGGRTWVYVGPVEGDNGVLIERLKGLVDAALG